MNKQRVEEKWTTLMKGITKASVETSVLPGAQERHTITTMRCGPLAFFCDKCFEICHMQGLLHFFLKNGL